MKVYIIITESCYDYEANKVEVDVFDAKEKAKKYFDASVKGEKREAESLQWETEESMFSFTAWEQGYYDSNHISIEMREEEVR